jgi:hypothetical protein
MMTPFKIDRLLLSTAILRTWEGSAFPGDGDEHSRLINKEIGILEGFAIENPHRAREADALIERFATLAQSVRSGAPGQ